MTDVAEAVAVAPVFVVLAVDAVLLVVEVVVVVV